MNSASLDELYRYGAAAWPAIACSREAFEAGVARSKLDDRSAANGADLYIAAAVLSGDAKALAAFESAFLEAQRGRLRRLGLCPAGVDDVLQIIRERVLLAGPDRPEPRIAELAGQGSFHALFRVIAVRTGLNMLRSQGRRRRNEDDAAVELLCAGDRTIRPVLRAEAVHLLREAIEKSVRSLSPKDKTLLRLHFSHGLTIDEIGRIYGVHRATAARWLCRVRETIETRVKAYVQDERGQTTTNLRELLHLASSQLQISFDRLLASTTGAYLA